MADAVLDDITNDRPLDVAARARELGLEAPPYHPDGLPVVRTAELVERGERPLWKRDMDFKDMLPLAKAWWMENYAPVKKNGKTVHRGVQTAGGEVLFKGVEGWKKYSGNISPDKIRIIPFLDEILKAAIWGKPEAPRREAHRKQKVTIHPLRAAVEIDGRILDVSLTVRESRGKFFYDLGEIERSKKTNPSDTSGHPVSVSRTPDGQEIIDGRTPHPTDATGRTDHGAVTDSPDATVTTPHDNVNLQVRDVTPDYRPEPPEVNPAPDATPENRAIADKALDYETQRLLEEGRVTPEEVALISETEARIETVNREEDVALSVLSCVMGADWR